MPDKATPLLEKALPRVSSRETILIIEDEVGFRAIIRMFLESQGYSVLTAGCGPDGLSLYRQHLDSVQVVIIDARMPDMDGAEVMWALREINPEVRIVAVSGTIAARFPEEPGRLKFLLKPMSGVELMSAVQDVMPKRQA